MKFIFFVLVVVCTVCQSASRAKSISNQLNQLLQKLKDKRIAMLTNPTSVDQSMAPLFNRIIQESLKYNITLKCFFAPEHGLRGDRQDGRGDDDYIDAQTGIQVYSLYGTRKAPLPSQLEGIDIFLYDIQDVGARYYTYIWTLTYTIQVLAQLKIKLIIFDRPNPLGRKIEGCPLTFDAGLVGRLLPGQSQSIPLRYGLTIGELIGYLSPYLPSFSYEVIKMNPYYEITQEDWVMSSPNMPTLATVHVYAGMALIEGTSISEGRGTTKPFQLTGYPGIEANKLVSWLKLRINTNSTYLRESYIIPTTSKHTGEVCGGLQLMPKSISATFYDYDSVETALYVIKGYLTFNDTISMTNGIDKLFGYIGFSQMIRIKEIAEIVADCKVQSKSYEQNYQQYWLYGKGLKSQ